MKLSRKERNALAEMAKPVGQRDYTSIHGRTIHGLERKGLLGLEGTHSRHVTAAGRDELSVPDVFDDLFKEKGRQTMSTITEQLSQQPRRTTSSKFGSAVRVVLSVCL